MAKTKKTPTKRKVTQKDKVVNTPVEPKDEEVGNTEPDVEQKDETSMIYRYQVFSPKPGNITVGNEDVTIHAGHNVIKLSTEDVALEKILKSNGMKLIAKLFS